MLKRELNLPRSKEFDTERASSQSEEAKREFERVQKEQDCLKSCLTTLRSMADYIRQLSSLNSYLSHQSSRMIEESKELAVEAEHMRNSARKVLFLLSDCYDYLGTVSKIHLRAVPLLNDPIIHRTANSTLLGDI